MTPDEDQLVRRLLVQWRLEPTGASWSTASSLLTRVRRFDDGMLAMLKVPRVDEERIGARVLRWWSGEGAARVLELNHDGSVLMEHARAGKRPLVDRARSASAPGWTDDLAATRTLVEVSMRLHRHPQVGAPAAAVPLRRWFRGLGVRAAEVGGFLSRAAAVAEELLADERDPCVLHGDVHHENVLWFGPGRGWLAIDPKGLVGEPAFDFANILTNPDRATMLRSGRFHQHVDLVVEVAGVERDRLLRWVMAWCGLSTSWHRSSVLDTRAAGVLELGLVAERLLRGGGGLVEG